MKFSELIQEAHATAVEKGWHEGKEKTIDRAAALFLLVHDEVTEASEARGVEDFAGEVSDIMIRVADAYGFFGWEYTDFEVFCPSNFGVYFTGSAGIHATISEFATRPLRKTGAPAEGCAAQLNCLLTRWFLTVYAASGGQFLTKTLEEKLATVYTASGGQSLTKTLEEKLAFNKTRSYRHGNKLL